METMNFIVGILAYLGMILILGASILGFIGVCAYGFMQFLIHFDKLMRGEKQ